MTSILTLPGNQRSRLFAAGGAVALVAIGIGLWSAFAPPTDRPALGISNGTTLDVSLFVNDARVGEYPAGGPTPIIRAVDLPALPWTVEARSSSGRVLTSMRVEPGQIVSTTRPDGGSSYRGTFGRVDLSCGRLTIWAGDIAPSGPAPPASPGQAGDCQP